MFGALPILKRIKVTCQNKTAAFDQNSKFVHEMSRSQTGMIFLLEVVY